jgi:hypothetical protein
MDVFTRRIYVEAGIPYRGKSGYAGKRGRGKIAWGFVLPRIRIYAFSLLPCQLIAISEESDEAAGVGTI